MKRMLIATLPLIFVCSLVVAQKIAIKCPHAKKLTDITACPLIGCGPSLDPLLNQQKNIRSSSKAPAPKTIQDLKDLPDPVSDFKIGDPRGKLKRLGEGENGQTEHPGH